MNQIDLIYYRSVRLNFADFCTPTQSEVYSSTTEDESHSRWNTDEEDVTKENEQKPSDKSIGQTDYKYTNHFPRLPFPNPCEDRCATESSSYELLDNETIAKRLKHTPIPRLLRGDKYIERSNGVKVEDSCAQTESHSGPESQSEVQNQNGKYLHFFNR